MVNFLKLLGIGNGKRNASSQDTCILLTMPNDVMNEILGKLDFKEILKLRKVCRDLRDFVNENVNLHLDRVKICGNGNKAHLSLSGHGKANDFDYKNVKNGCIIVYWEDNIKKKFIRGGNYMKMMFNDFSVILRLQKSVLKHMEVQFNHYDISSPVFSSKLHEIMASVNPKTIQLHTTVSQLDHIMCTLPYLHTESLESIKIQSTQSMIRFPYEEQHLNLEKIVELEQWKKAKRLAIYGFFVKKQDLAHFQHASKIDVKLEQLKYEDLVEWKESFLRHNHLQQVFLCYRSINNVNLSNLFGQLDTETRFSDYSPHAKCCFRIANSEEIIQISWWTRLEFQLERTIFDRNDNYNLIHG